MADVQIVKSLVRCGACEKAYPDWSTDVDWSDLCEPTDYMGDLRNFVTLPKLASITGVGCWGNLVIHMPNIGAMALVCDSCVEEGREIRFAINGPPQLGLRVSIDELEPLPEFWESRLRDLAEREGEDGRYLSSFDRSIEFNNIHVDNDDPDDIGDRSFEEDLYLDGAP